MVSRLLQANLNNDPALLNEVLVLLAELRDAWDAIGGARPGSGAQLHSVTAQP